MSATIKQTDTVINANMSGIFDHTRTLPNSLSLGGNNSFIGTFKLNNNSILHFTNGNALKPTNNVIINTGNLQFAGITTAVKFNTLTINSPTTILLDATPTLASGQHTFDVNQINLYAPLTIKALNTGKNQTVGGIIVGTTTPNVTALTLDGSLALFNYTITNLAATPDVHNDFHGIVNIIGNVYTTNNNFYNNKPLQENNGFRNNDIFVNVGAFWHISSGSETIQALNGYGTTQSSGGFNGIGLVVGNNDATGGVYNGIINGGKVTKIGTGTQTFSGLNGYSGTIINGGELKAGHIKAFGTATITINAGGILNKNGFAIANTIINNGGTVIP